MMTNIYNTRCRQSYPASAKYKSLFEVNGTTQIAILSTSLWMLLKKHKCLRSYHHRWNQLQECFLCVHLCVYTCKYVHANTPIYLCICKHTQTFNYWTQKNLVDNIENRDISMDKVLFPLKTLIFEFPWKILNVNACFFQGRS